MRYCNIFRKSDEDFDRYWMSISTEKLGKDGKGTGEYIRASITVRLGKKAKEVFAENCSKTKNKEIKQGCFELKGCSLEAVQPKEGEPFVILFIWEMEPEDD